MPGGRVSLVLVNANVFTMDPARPKAEAVAVSGAHISAVSSNASVRALASDSTEVIDCQGLTLLPGFNDAHCHLPGLARRLQDLDCGPRVARSIAGLQALVQARAATRALGSWVRGFGYDDLQIAERRHPSRHDLDAAARNHPVWLEHRSGHADALNTKALELAGIHRETPAPPGGVIERDPSNGEPTGPLHEMHTYLRQRLGSTRTRQEFDDGMRDAGKLLSGYGICSVQDAGHDNGIERWRTFERLQSAGVLVCRITMFAGIDRLDEFAADGLSFGSGSEFHRLGHAKIVVTLTSGGLHPAFNELKSLVEDSHKRGFPVAIHCIEEEAIAAATVVLSTSCTLGLNDRIEHCAEGTPDLIAAVGRSGATVVTQPGFIFHNGASYRENVDARLRPHLYPAGQLLRAGVTMAFGSDAPVIDPNPWAGIYSAVTRCASDGRPLTNAGTEEQVVSAWQALRAYTLGAAEAEGTSTIKGSIVPGKLADLVLVDSDPLRVDHEALPEVRPVMTVVGGSVVWDNR